MLERGFGKMKKLLIFPILLLVALVVLIGMGAGACRGGEEAPPTAEEEKEAAVPEEETEVVTPEEVTPGEEKLVPPEEEEAVQPAPPAPGEWTATTQFGELGFIVTPDSQGISKISLKFPGVFKCGGVTVSGGSASVEFTNPKPITNGRFTVNTSISLGKVIIEGSFDKTGQRASGTWEINTCSGKWETQ